MSETWVKKQKKTRECFQRLVDSNPELFIQLVQEARSRFGQEAVVRVQIKTNKLGSHILPTIQTTREAVREVNEKQDLETYRGEIVQALLKNSRPFIPSTPFMLYSKYGLSFLRLTHPAGHN
ncbi:MAG: hypothetical protein EBT03_07980 [Betaproteobacteria bacterium]|nr:hypothetical protein [Betaproteobacteria bacterium]